MRGYHYPVPAVPIPSWGPLRDIENLLGWLGSFPGGYPLADIEEDEAGYKLTIEAPGFGKDQIEVEIRDNMVIVSGRSASDKEEHSSRHLQRERVSKSFRRAFQLPEPIDQKAASAQYQEGVLSVILPKLSERSVRKLDIQ